MIALYIILGISLVALGFLFVVVMRGGSKNTKSFQRELALRQAKKDSKQLAKDYVEGKITFEQLQDKIYNQDTLRRVQINEEKQASVLQKAEDAKVKLTFITKEIQKLESSVNQADQKVKSITDKNSNQYQNAAKQLSDLNNQLKIKRLEANELTKEIGNTDSIIKQLKYDLKLIISNYSYGAKTGTSATKLTRSEKVEEKAAVKAAMKEKRIAWKAEDEVYYAEAKANAAELKIQVAESKIKLKELAAAYKAEKKELAALELAENGGKKKKEPRRKKGAFIQIEDPLQAKISIQDDEEYNEKHPREKEYREFLKQHERLVQKYRIEKDRYSFGRKVERWSKRGGHLRREIFIKRQYYYLVAPYTVLFVIFTVVPVLMSLYFSFTYFNLLEPPTFIGWENYMRLFVDDKVFIISLRNTAIMAVITGPLSYLMAFLFAWLINELRPLARSIMTLIFYAPSISGNVYLVWKLIFSSDIYGYANSILLKLNLIKEPVTWLQNADYIIWILIIVQLWLSLGVSFLSFIAGLQSVNRELYEAGAIDGIKNRWQELWFITLPQMKSQLIFGAVMQITSSLAVAEVSTQIAGFPSIEYAGHTIITHLQDYGSIRMEMGYASAIATILFIIMIACNVLIRKVIRRVGS